jgi:FG-GAP-like repeat
LNGDGKKDLLVGDSDGLVFLFLNEGTDAEPKLAAGRQLEVGGKPFTWEGTRIKPEVVDWNNDGQIDLLLGEERGKVLLLLNSGTKSDPVFEEAVFLKDGDADLKVWMRCDPAVTDWDGDGKKDLLLADEGGHVTLFRNRGTDAAPAFAGGELLRARGWPLSPGTAGYFREDLDGDGKQEVVAPNSKGGITIYQGSERPPLLVAGKPWQGEPGRPKIRRIDFNADGRFDILIGEASGAVSVALNTGEGKAAEFGRLLVLKDGDDPLNGGPGVNPRFEDFDGDEVPDLACFDEDGGLRCFRNTGTAKEPVLESVENPEKESSEICGGYRSRLDVADWNGDGKADLIYGVTSYKDSRSRVYVFLR